MSLAFVFPGQASQSIGMMSALARISPVITATFAEASSVLGYDLWQRCREGPAELLNSTECTQPAMLTAGIATYRLWRERGGAKPKMMAGHSLGEWSALVAAEYLDFKSAVDLVKYRGELMQAAVPSGQGGIAAILGLEDADVEAACQEAAQGEVVEAVNFNAPGQVVIAGLATAVARAIEIATAKGARRAMALPMSVPAHSSLMQPAAEK
jgi:[acyl-carrier-protein] S-malonyltransferase